MATELRRGELRWLDVAGVGMPMKKTRPVLVLQNDIGNQFAPTTIVVAVRSDVRKGLPVQVSVPKGVAGLTKDSVIDCGYVATVARSTLGEALGTLPPEYLRRVEEAAMKSLGIST